MTLFRFQVKSKTDTVKMVIDLRPQKVFVVVFPFIKKVGPLLKKRRADTDTKLTYSVTEKLETFLKIPGDVKLNPAAEILSIIIYFKFQP